MGGYDRYEWRTYINQEIDFASTYTQSGLLYTKSLKQRTV